MCIVETRIYTSAKGNERLYECARRCKYAYEDSLCQNVTYKECRLLETRPPGEQVIARTEDGLVFTQDKNGNEKAYRTFSRREGKAPAQSASSSFPVTSASITTEERRPPAPSPPPPPPGQRQQQQQHQHKLAFCPRQDCPLMSGAGDVERYPPMTASHNDFIYDTSPAMLPGKKTVTIKTPSEYMQGVPKLSRAPSERKITGTGHKRQDSAKGFSSNREPIDNEFYAREAAREQARQHRIDQDREARIEAELRRIREETREHIGREQAGRRREAHREVPQDMARQQERASFIEDEKRARQQQAEEAAKKAYRNGQRAQQDADNDDNREQRRLRGEQRARDEERQDAEQRSRESDSRRRLTNQPASPTSTRRRAVIHQQVTQQSSTNEPVDIIEREQLRLQREEEAEAAAARQSLDDPLVEDPYSTRGEVFLEYSISETDARRERMRRYRDAQQRRLE